MRDFDKQMEMVLYHSDEGDVSVDAYIKDESIWITQKAMAELFGVQVPAISKHLKKIFEEGELDEKVVISKMEITSPHGAIPDKIQTSEAMFYNLEYEKVNPTYERLKATLGLEGRIFKYISGKYRIFIKKSQ